MGRFPHRFAPPHSKLRTFRILENENPGVSGCTASGFIKSFNNLIIN